MNSKNIINLGNKTFALLVLEQLKENDYVPFDVEITNSHITELNELTGKKLFSKASLFVNSNTIHELMQPIGGKGQHNYHGLTPEDIYMALSSIKDPKYVFIVKNKRYAIISIELSHYKNPLMIVVETGAGTLLNDKANINKVVTIYPKNYVDEYIAKLDKRKLLYKK